MTKKLHINSDEVKEREIDPSIIAEVESKLAVLGKYEKELIRPVILSATSIIFYLIYINTHDILSSMNRQYARELSNAFAELGYNISIQIFNMFLNMSTVAGFGGFYYFTFRGINNLISRFTNLSDWFSRKLIGDPAEIHLDDFEKNYKSIIDKVNSQIEHAKVILQNKVFFYEAVISPMVILRNVGFTQLNIFSPLETIGVLALSPDFLITKQKLLMVSFKYRERIRSQLDELCQDYVSGKWEEYDSGFFVLKLPRQTKKKSTSREDLEFKPHHFLEVLKNVFLRQKDLWVIAHQTNAIAIMKPKFFFASEMIQLRQKISEAVENKKSEQQNLFILNKINRLLKIEAEWQIHYCKTTKHLTRFQLALKKIPLGKYNDLNNELKTIFPLEKIATVDEIINVTSTKLDFNQEIRQLSKKNQNHTAYAMSIIERPNQESKQELPNNDNKNEPTLEIKHHPIKQKKSPTSKLKDGVKKLPYQNTQIFWRRHHYSSDKEGSISEMRGCYLKKGSYFCYFEKRLARILTEEQYTHYEKISNEGKVVPRRKTQGIVACNEYVKGFDNKWHLSIFKLKDPTKNIRIHGIEIEEPVKVDNIKRHLIQFSVVKIK